MQPPEVRMATIAQDKGTNYGVVRLELLEKIHGTIYEQRIKTNDEEKWQHRILPFRYVTGVEDLINDRVRLHIKDNSSGFGESSTSRAETLDVDAVFAATGYVRKAHEDILRPAEHLRPKNKDWTVSRNYRVQFEAGTVSEDAGVWLQGCNETTHGLSDVLLSILATRAGEVVQSIFGTSLLRSDPADVNRSHGIDSHGFHDKEPLIDSDAGPLHRRGELVRANGTGAEQVIGSIFPVQHGRVNGVA